LRVKLAVLLLTTPASAARPEAWDFLGERLAEARRHADGGGGDAASVATVGDMVDLLSVLSLAGAALAVGLGFLAGAVERLHAKPGADRIVGRAEVRSGARTGV